MKIVVEELGLGMLAIVGGLAVYKLVASVYLFITAFCQEESNCGKNRGIFWRCLFGYDSTATGEAVCILHAAGRWYL